MYAAKVERAIERISGFTERGGISAEAARMQTEQLEVRLRPIESP